MAEARETLLSVEELTTCFTTPRGLVRAVDRVSFSVGKGEILGVVGESGCGKSVTAQSVMRLIPEPPGKITHGRIMFDGQDLAALPKNKMKDIRGNRISMIFQEPMTSLNPVKPIGWQIGEMFRRHRNVGMKKSLTLAEAMLEKVQIPEPAKRVYTFPHQLSGGMRQRAMIAMALACDPEILIADEPTTALDVTVQAQIIDLMKRLQADFHTAILMITHDLGVIADMAHRVIVMYAGKVVESADTAELFKAPAHPYTQGLLRSVPILGRRRPGKAAERLNEIPGMVPDLASPPEGCLFSPRCSRADGACRNGRPKLVRLSPGREVRCWHPLTDAEGGTP